MEPTLCPGDTVFVTPYARGAQPSRGDVVVFRSPANPAEMVVKRVVAEPGDLIESRDGKIFVGGHAVAEPYAIGATTALAPQIVPGDSVFVLGDNRMNSYDSRLLGSIARGAIVGRARLVLWSAIAAPRASASEVSPGASSTGTNVRVFKVVR